MSYLIKERTRRKKNVVTTVHCRWMGSSGVPDFFQLGEDAGAFLARGPGWSSREGWRDWGDRRAGTSYCQSCWLLNLRRRKRSRICVRG